MRHLVLFVVLFAASTGTSGACQHDYDCHCRNGETAHCYSGSCHCRGGCHYDYECHSHYCRNGETQYCSSGSCHCRASTTTIGTSATATTTEAPSKSFKIFR
ncbi:uncharacterized protein LOC144624996 [Crassostrea virginica]